MTPHVKAQQLTELEQCRIDTVTAYNIYSDALYYENECKDNVKKYNEISANYYYLALVQQMSGNYQTAIELQVLAYDYYGIAKFYENQVTISHTATVEAWRDYYLLLQRYIYLRDHQ